MATKIIDYIIYLKDDSFIAIKIIEKASEIFYIKNKLVVNLLRIYR
jgi:hypothetical protein